MKHWMIIVITAVFGFIAGWVGVSYAIVQPWWPLSASEPITDQTEIAVSGILTLSSGGIPTGLTIQDSTQTTFVDISQLGVGTAAKYLDQQVSARGQIVEGPNGSYLIVSWLK
ncbi:MAG: hypothetical protein Q7S31_00585 [bacterium]|nr:hypothetical protein [bacterium]